MIYSLSKRTQFSLLVHSQRLLTVPVHWFGRTFLCPGGEECPACYTSRPKRYHYAVCTVEKRIEVVEFCDSLGRSLLECVKTLCMPTPCGMVMRCSRKSKRSIWDYDAIEYHPEFAKEVPDQVLIDGVSQLYQLPLRTPGASVQDWYKAVKNFHVAALSKCVIPM